VGIWANRRCSRIKNTEKQVSRIRRVGSGTVSDKRPETIIFPVLLGGSKSLRSAGVAMSHRRGMRSVR
jgi:hypothetical protein